MTAPLPALVDRFKVNSSRTSRRHSPPPGSNEYSYSQSRALEDTITVQEDDIYNALDKMADSAPQAWLENELHWLNVAPTRRLD